MFMMIGGAFRSTLAIALVGIFVVEATGQGRVETDRPQSRGVVAGRMLADSLIRGCPIFIGRLEEVVGPADESAGQAPRRLFYSKTTIRVDEWLNAAPANSQSELTLGDVPLVASWPLTSESPAYPWRGVDLVAGARLVIAFPPGEVPGTTPLRAIHQYRMVVSDDALIPSIRETIAAHERYAKEPGQISDASRHIHSYNDSVFLGYLCYYLWARGGLDRAETDAPVLAQLVADASLPDGLKRGMLEPALTRAVMNMEHPISSATRQLVTLDLIAAACGDNVEHARSPLRILVLMSARGDVGRSISPGCKEQIITNYRATLVPGSVEGQDSFEAQLGLSRRL